MFNAWPENDAQEASFNGGPDANATHLNGIAPVLPASKPSWSNASRKRESSASDTEIPNKKQHTIHLPHVLLVGSSEAKEAGTRALQENLIVPVSLKSAKKLLKHYISSVVKVKRSIARTIVIVCNGAESSDSIINVLQKKLANVDFGVPSRSDDISDWEKLLEKDILILTSSLLARALRKGFITSSQVYTVVLTDVEDVALQKLTRALFSSHNQTDHPRILAMITSENSSAIIPLDDKLLQLETILHAKLYGLSDEERMDFLSRLRSPKELVVIYDPPVRPTNTGLFQKLQEIPDVSATNFSGYHEVLVELGPFAADMLLRKTVETEIVKKDQAITQLIESWQPDALNLDVASQNFNATPKFVRLVQVLQSYEHYGREFRGIIFVRRDTVAHLILSMLRNLSSSLDFLHSEALFGTQPDDVQYDILLKFSEGRCNLLVATLSTQDLEFPSSCLVVRFDLLDSEMAQAYVCSCTRGDGHLIYMAEKGNVQHRYILSRTTPLCPEVTIMCRTLESSVPRHALLETRYSDLSQHEAGSNEAENSITDPTTGAQICLHNAVTAVHQLAWHASCHLNQNAVSSPLFEFDTQGESAVKHRCRVTIPGISGCWSPPCISRAHARRIASFQICTTLFDDGLLPYHLFSAIGSAGSANWGGLPTLGEKRAGTRSYPRKTPDFWKRSVVPVSRLYPTAIRMTGSSNTSKPHGPMVLLTRRPLPEIPSFKIFFSSVPATIQLTCCAPLLVDPDKLEQLYKYTLRAWETILNKPFDCPLDQVLGFFAPLNTDWNPGLGNNGPFVLPQIDAQVAWDLVRLAANEFIIPTKYQNPDEIAADLEDAIIQDRWTRFTRRYEVLAVREDLSPLSKPLDSQYAEYENYIEICRARRFDFQGLKNDCQPLIEVLKVPVFTDRLNPAFMHSQETSGRTEEPQGTVKFFIPELCAKYTIPASTFRTIMLLPCILRRIDDYLLVKELNARIFGHSINDQFLHMALSTPSAGIEYDYERLELLGDTFLKFLATLYVFVTNPNDGEGTMHLLRQKVISNKALMDAAIAVQLPPFIQSRPLALKNFVPSIFQKSSKNLSPKPRHEHATEDMDVYGLEIDNLNTKQVDPGSLISVERKSKKTKEFNNQETQNLGDKAIADVAEAIIGAAFLSGGIDNALKVMKALSLPLPGIEQWSDLGRKSGVTPLLHGSTTFQVDFKTIEAIIGCQIKCPELLAQALTHVSRSKSQASSYERLEFIGDAILDFMVIRHIFDRDQNLAPGALTMLKGAMVSNSALAAVSVSTGLHKHLIIGSPHVAGEIREYETLLLQKRQKEYGVAQQEGRSPGQYWLDLEPPKTLSDMVESIIGAIFLSDDFSPDGVEKFFASVLKPFYDKYIHLQTLSHHPTKVLFELIQGRGCHQSQIVREDDETLVLVHGIVLASARDTSSMSAARLASFLALDALEGDASFLKRTCDCWTNRFKKRTPEEQQASIDQMLSLEAHSNDL